MRGVPWNGLADLQLGRIIKKLTEDRPSEEIDIVHWDNGLHFCHQQLLGLEYINGSASIREISSTFCATRDDRFLTKQPAAMLGSQKSGSVIKILNLYTGEVVFSSFSLMCNSITPPRIPSLALALAPSEPFCTNNSLPHSMVKPVSSALMTKDNLASSSAWLSYIGRSSLLKHVCARGYSESCESGDRVSGSWG